MYWRLRAAILDKYGTYGAFSKALDMHYSTLSGKLRGQTDWTLPEMLKVIDLLGVSAEEAHLYFFAR